MTMTIEERLAKVCRAYGFSVGSLHSDALEAIEQLKEGIALLEAENEQLKRRIEELESPPEEPAWEPAPDVWASRKSRNWR